MDLPKTALNHLARSVLKAYINQFNEYLEKELKVSVNVLEGGIAEISLMGIEIREDDFNKLLKKYSLPFYFLNGGISQIKTKLPFKFPAYIPEDKSIDITVHNLNFSISPKNIEFNASLLESLFESVHETFKECIEQEKPEADVQSLKIMENFSKYFNTLMNNVKIVLYDTILNLHYTQSQSDLTIQLQIKIDKIFYSIESDIKKIRVEGIAFYLNEQLNERSYSRMQSHLKEPVLILKLLGNLIFSLNYRQKDTQGRGASISYDKKIEANIVLDSLNVFLSPCQLHILIKLFRAFSQFHVTSKEKTFGEAGTDRPINNDDFIIIQQDLLKQIEEPIIDRDKGWSQEASSEDSFYSFNDSSTTKMHQHNILQDNLGFTDQRIYSLVISKCNIMILEDEANDLKALSSRYFENGLCRVNHIFLNACKIYAEYFEQFGTSNSNLVFKASCNSLVILEHLYQSCEVVTELLSFNNNYIPKGEEEGNCCDMTYTQRKDAGIIPKAALKGSWSISLKPVYTEIDISIIDRLHSLFNAKPLCDHFPTFKTSSNLPELKTMISLKASCPFIVACLRFPIPDLRLPHRREPSWHQNVRPEKFILKFKEFTFQTNLASYNPSLEFQAKIVNGYFEINKTEPPHLIFVVEPPEEDDLKDKGFDWPRLVLSFNNKGTNSLLSYGNDLYETTDPCSFKFDISPCDKIMIINKMIMKDQQNDSGTTSFLPNTKENIKEFIENTMQDSLSAIDISFPTIKLYLPNKDVYELLYNRLFNDLVLWEPQKQSRLAESKQAFYACKSMKDSSSDEENSNYLHYSHFNNTNFNMNVKPAATAQHRISINLTVSRGMAEVCTDSSLAIDDIKDGQIFIVSGFKGEEGKGYVSFQCNNGVLLHKKKPIICPSATKKEVEDLVSIVIQTYFNPDNSSKTIKVIIGVTGAIFNYLNYETSLGWLPHIQKYFDVEDHPIKGYTPRVPDLTLNVHFKNSSVKYLPSASPFRACLKFDGLMFLSDLINHKIIVERASLSLAATSEQRLYKQNSVKVASVDFFTFSIIEKLQSEAKNREVCHEYKASNNNTHIWLCADSMTALLYLASKLKEEVQSSEKQVQNSLPSNEAPGNESLMADAINESESFSACTQSPHVAIEDEEEEEDDDEFCYIEIELGAGIAPKSGEPVVRTLTDQEIVLQDDYFAAPLGNFDSLQAPAKFPPPIDNYVIKEMNLVFHLYGGTDFPTIGSTSPKHQRLASPKLSNRQNDVLMEIHLNKIRACHSVYSSESEYASRQVFVIKSFEVHDKLAKSNLNKFLYPHISEKYPMRSHSNQIEIRLLHYRPENNSSIDECDLYVSLTPLRLNVDQTSFLFLNKFFQSVFGGDNATLFQKNSESQPIFFKKFTFSPDVLCKLDYSSKMEDEDSGLASFLMNCFNLNDTDLVLKRLQCNKGILGVEKLVAFAFAEWSSDISQNQLHIVLTSLGKLHNLRKVMMGIRDIVYLPYKQYQTDGRLIQGFQKGAESFKKCTLGSLLDFCAQFFDGLQGVAEFLEGCMTPGPSLPPAGKPVPKDMSEGIKLAAELIRDSFMSFSSTMMAIAYEEHKHKGLPGAIGGLARHAPSAVLVKPVILAAQATTVVLEGARNHLNPDAHRESLEKWKKQGAKPHHHQPNRLSSRSHSLH